MLERFLSEALEVAMLENDEGPIGAAATWHNWQWFSKYIWSEDVTLPAGGATLTVTP